MGIVKRLRLQAVGFLALFLSVTLCRASFSFQNGDIIFQELPTSQSLAIQLATHSPYSHVGMVLFRGSVPYVVEAVQPVSVTPLQNWIHRGSDSHYVVKRLKNSAAVFTPAAVVKLKEEAKRYLGKDYDSLFDWSDKEMYCSELVWKLYSRALGIKLCPLRKLKSFDLSHPEVKRKLFERYGSSIPLEEPVVAPSDLYDSSLLMTVVNR